MHGAEQHMEGGISQKIKETLGDEILQANEVTIGMMNMQGQHNEKNPALR